MFVNAASTFALHCQQCGKIQTHDISHFHIKKMAMQLKCSCGCVQATLVRASHGQFILSIPCLVCQLTHNVYFSSKKLLRTKIDKVYCVQNNFELGYLGTRAAIDAVLAEQARESASLIRETDREEPGEHIERQHIVLGILNKVHDIAEQGDVYCCCGGDAVEAGLLPDCILLECMNCGAYYTIGAQTEHDLQYARSLDHIELISRHYLAKRIDFD